MGANNPPALSTLPVSTLSGGFLKSTPRSVFRAMWVLVLATLLSWTPASATQVAISDTPCPLDGASSRVFEQVSSNTRGGYDSDLCSYSSHGQWRDYALVTCPVDLLTLYGVDFKREYDEQTLETLREVSRQVVAEVADPDALHIWDRYALAVRFYRALGKDEAFIADLYLRASWTARDRAVGFIAGLEGPLAAKALLEGGAAELEKPLTGEQRKTVIYNLARVAHRAGQNALRDHYLALFEAQGDLDDKEREALQTFRWVSAEIEPHFQDEAIAALRTYLASEPSTVEAGMRATYLLADLLRRRSRSVESLPLYHKVAENPSSPQDMRDMAQFFIDEMAD